MAQKKNIRSFRDAWLADFLSIQRHIERSLLKSIPRYHESWTSLMLPLHRDLRFLREPIRRVIREITGILLH